MGVMNLNHVCLLSLVVHGFSDYKGVQGNCTDFKKQTVATGQRFIPLGYDPCTTCTCENGEAEMCNSVLCSPPKDCLNSQLADDKCCEFMCKNGDVDLHPIFNFTNVKTEEIDTFNTTNLGLRLVASTVTSFLILALLLFMIHRLRQRRLLLMIQRFNNNLNPGPCGNRQFPLRDHGSVGYFAHQDQVAFGYFEDPPPPYTFWKPPETYFTQEAPPPYEIALNANPIISPVGPPRSLSSGLGISYQLPLPSLSNVSLHTNNFQINDLDRERSGNEQTPSIPIHSLNVTGSMSSLHENNANVDVDRDTMAIRSDATYEEFPCYQQDEHPIESNASINSELEYRTSGAAVKDLQSIPNTHKYHSCSDMVDCWQQKKYEDKDIHDEIKRHSLQSPLSRKCKGTRSFPDPTSWIGDASESSSSSSPTYEQRTASPTSSDSSSIDYHLPCDSDNSRLVSGYGSKLPNFQLYSARSAPFYSDAKEGSSSGKTPHTFDRTLNQIKKRVMLRKKGRPSSIKECAEKEKIMPTVQSEKERNAEIAAQYSGLPKSHKECGKNEVDSCDQCRAGHSNHTARLSYVSDGEESSSPSLMNERLRSVSQSSSRQARPKSYDFGDLSSATTYSCSEEIPSAVATISGSDEKNESGLQTDCCCSLDSITCSSRASFGSTVSSSGREGPASPSSLCSPIQEHVVNLSNPCGIPGPAHSSNEAPSASRDLSAVHNNIGAACAGVSHSRSASVCSETGERKHQGLSLLLLPESGHGSHLVRNQTRQFLRNPQQIRLNLRTSKQNHESYI